MGDNGNIGGIESKDENKKEDIVVKTDEQLKIERSARHTSNPETFIELSDLICVVVRNPKSQLGVSVFIGNVRRSEIDIGQSELNHRIELTRRQMDIEAEMKHQSKIVPAKHGILDFRRRK